MSCPTIDTEDEIEKAMVSMKSLAWIAAMGFILVALDVPVARSQTIEPTKDRPASQPISRRTAWLHEVYLREASEYSFSLDDPKRDKLELRREPIMRWTSGGDYNGEVYVWTHQGSAAIVGSMFSAPQGEGVRRIMHEFHSLSAEPIVGEGRGGSRWQSKEAGLTLEPVPDAPEPARSEVLRLAQMRDISRRFSSQIDREGMSEMRLLTQPVYRYEIKDKDAGEVVDGAVFAFIWTAATDPEVLVVIEARRKGDDVRWHYALARFTNRAARVKYQGREIWRVEGATIGIFDGVTTKRYGAFSVKTVPVPAELLPEPKP